MYVCVCVCELLKFILLCYLGLAYSYFFFVSQPWDERSESKSPLSASSFLALFIIPLVFASFILML